MLAFANIVRRQSQPHNLTQQQLTTTTASSGNNGTGETTTAATPSSSPSSSSSSSFSSSSSTSFGAEAEAEAFANARLAELRKDVVTESIDTTAEQTLSHAAVKEGPYFSVPRVVGDS
jgi:hypothetical protein